MIQYVAHIIGYKIWSILYGLYNMDNLISYSFKEIKPQKDFPHGISTCTGLSLTGLFLIFNDL